MNIQTRGMRRSVAVAGLLAGLVFGAGGVMAQADTNANPMPGPDKRPTMEARCKADPQKCEAFKQRMEERRKEMKAQCEKDPQVCQQKREEHRARKAERRKEMQAQCEKDPVACEQKREEMRKRFEAKCKADPQKCEEMKHKHRPMRTDDKPVPPPLPQAAQ